MIPYKELIRRCESRLVHCRVKVREYARVDAYRFNTAIDHARLRAYRYRVLLSYLLRRQEREEAAESCVTLWGKIDPAAMEDMESFRVAVMEGAD